MNRAAPAAHQWGWQEALFGFAAGILLSTIAVGIARSASGDPSGSGQALSPTVLVADLCALWVGLTGAAVVASRRHGTGSLAEDFGLRFGRWWDPVLGAAVGLGCQFGLIPLLYLPFEHVDHSLAHRPAEPAQTDTGSVHGLLGAAVLLLFLAVGAPLVEELFFRGLLLRALASRMPIPVAVVVSALLFALAHFEAVQFAGLAVFGVLLGALAWRTGRLGPGIAAHAAFNAAAVITSVHLH